MNEGYELFCSVIAALSVIVLTMIILLFVYYYAKPEAVIERGNSTDQERVVVDTYSVSTAAIGKESVKYDSIYKTIFMLILDAVLGSCVSGAFIRIGRLLDRTRKKTINSDFEK